MRNILEIIKKMPTGRVLFSVVAGNGSFRLSNCPNAYHPIILDGLNGKDYHTTYDEFGRLYHNLENGECVIFPSGYCRDWNEWAVNLVKDGDIVALKDGKVVRFDYTRIYYEDVARFASEDELTDETQDEQPTEKAIYVPKAIFEPFDKVLVADGAGDNWRCNIFSHYDAAEEHFICVTSYWDLCIPFKGNENLAGKIVTDEQVAKLNKVYNK